MSDFSRQREILDPSLMIFPVTIIGLGHIGSNLARELASLGCPSLVLWDPDKVEEANRPAGFFQAKQEGNYKVEALKENLGLFYPECKVETHKENFEGQKQLIGIVISGVDDMEARKKIWEKVRLNVSIPLYIDGRSGGEVIQCHTVRPFQIEDIEEYEKTLEHKGVPLPCGGRNIGYAARILAGIIASQMKKWIKQEEYSQKIIFNVGEGVLIQELDRNTEAS